MNMIDVMKGEKCIVRWFYGSAQPSIFAAHAIVNRQHDDVQNEGSLGTNLSQLNENENG